MTRTTVNGAMTGCRCLHRGHFRVGKLDLLEAAPLTRPDGSNPEAFYGRVAARYQVLVRRTAKPAVEMAEEAGVPVATARRWINEARRRQLLPAGRQGRAK